MPDRQKLRDRAETLGKYSKTVLRAQDALVETSIEAFTEGVTACMHKGSLDGEAAAELIAEYCTKMGNQ